MDRVEELWKGCHTEPIRIRTVRQVEELPPQELPQVGFWSSEDALSPGKGVEGRESGELGKAACKGAFGVHGKEGRGTDGAWSIVIAKINSP